MIAVSFSIRVGSIEFEKSLTPSFEGCMIPLEVAIIGVKQLIGAFCLGQICFTPESIQDLGKRNDQQRKRKWTSKRSCGRMSKGFRISFSASETKALKT